MQRSIGGPKLRNRPQKLLDQVRDTIRLNHCSLLTWTHCGIPIAPISKDVQSADSRQQKRASRTEVLALYLYFRFETVAVNG
jgi:hypothetical protein